MSDDDPQNAYQRGIAGIQRPEDGVWVAFYSDNSAAYVFETEIDALRYAVGESLLVKFWPFGAALSDVSNS